MTVGISEGFRPECQPNSRVQWVYGIVKPLVQRQMPMAYGGKLLVKHCSLQTVRSWVEEKWMRFIIRFFGRKSATYQQGCKQERPERHDRHPPGADLPKGGHWPAKGRERCRF